MNPDVLCRFLLWSLAENYAFLQTWILAFVFARNGLRALHGGSVQIQKKLQGIAPGIGQRWVRCVVHGVVSPLAIMKAATGHGRNMRYSCLGLHTRGSKTCGEVSPEWPEALYEQASG